MQSETPALIRLSALVVGLGTIQLAIRKSVVFRTLPDDVQILDYQVQYRMSNRRGKSGGKHTNTCPWNVASQSSSTTIKLCNILPNQQYQVSVRYQTNQRRCLRQLFHFCSPSEFTLYTKVKVFNSTPAYPMATPSPGCLDSADDIVMVDCIVDALLEKAACELLPRDDRAAIIDLVQWVVNLLEDRVVHNCKIKDKKGIIVHAIAKMLLIRLDRYELMLMGDDDVSLCHEISQLRSILVKCCKNEHKGVGKASYCLRLLRNWSTNLNELEDNVPSSDLTKEGLIQPSSTPNVDLNKCDTEQNQIIVSAPSFTIDCNAADDPSVPPCSSVTKENAEEPFVCMILGIILLMVIVSKSFFLILGLS